jgi:hypothetical protein
MIQRRRRNSSRVFHQVGHSFYKCAPYLTWVYAKGLAIEEVKKQPKKK